MRSLVLLSLISILQSCTAEDIVDAAYYCSCERTITENGVSRKGLPYAIPIGEKCEAPEAIIDSTIGAIVITTFDNCELD